MNEITIGEYTITKSEWDKDKAWIENAIGEGMEVTKAHLIRVFEKSLTEFWKENF